MVSEEIDATTLWPMRFSALPVERNAAARNYSPRRLVTSSSDDQSMSVCETPISLLRVPRGGLDSEPFTYPMLKASTRGSTARQQHLSSAPPAKVYRVNLGTPCIVPRLNLSSTRTNSPATKYLEPLSTQPDQLMMGTQSSSQYGSLVDEVPRVIPSPREPADSHWLTQEHGRLAKMIAIEKLKTIMRVTFHRSTVGAAFSVLKSNMHQARDIETRERLEEIIEQRRLELREWEAELEQAKAACEGEKEDLIRAKSEELEQLRRAKDSKIDELEIRLKVFEDDLKHEQLERLNATRASQRERMTELRDLSRKMKARVLTVRRKFRLLNYCMSTWYHARMKIWQRHELGRVHHELLAARHEASLVAHEVACARKELQLARQESDEIKKAVWSVWTNQVSSNDRRLKKLMRGLSRLVDGAGPDMQHGSKAFFETLMRHYRSSHPVQPEHMPRTAIAVG